MIRPGQFSGACNEGRVVSLKHVLIAFEKKEVSI